MNFTVPSNDWVLIPGSGERQVTNQGLSEVRIAKTSTKPTNFQDGVRLSTYDQAYASVFISDDDYYVVGVGGSSVINVQTV
jgi:hypothetical protein